MANAMTISRAATRAGVGVETIRFYERRGLIRQPLKPRNGGYRSYDDEAVARIRFIRQAQELGFSLREIEELLALRTDLHADCADVRMQAVAKRREASIGFDPAVTSGERLKEVVVEAGYAVVEHPQ